MRIKLRENKAIGRLLLICFFPLLFITAKLSAQVNKKEQKNGPLTKNASADSSRKGNTGAPNTVPFNASGDTTRIKDSSITVVDTLDLQVSPDSLSAPIKYAASDSGVLKIPEKVFLLYGQANTKYQTLDLSAGIIEIDNESSTAKAYFSKDSTGKVLNRPKLVDGDMTSESDSMFYNMKTQRGLTKSTYTKQGELFVHADRIKKFTATEYFAAKSTFTTCNLDTPHFAFRANKVKFVNQKWAYSGVVYPEFEGVPLPIGLPFGVFPLSQGRHSGFIAPTFTTTQNFGVGLEGLGYYKVLNENFDALVRANIYSYGGYNISIAPTYRVRYKYNGALRLNFQNTHINFKGDPDYQNTKTFNVGWNHTMDSKARPGTTFSANVNFGSTQYNSLVANNPLQNFTNQVNSSIQYSKTSTDGKENLSITANHSQNNQTGQYNVSLPTVSFTVNTMYPFQKKDFAGTPKWYQKLGIGYNGTALNQFSFFDRDSSALGPALKYNLAEIIDTMQWAAQHSVPISLSLPAIGPLQLSPGVSYQERWYGQQMTRSWNDVTKKVDTSIAKGFYTAREMSFSFSAATAIFGTVNFKKSSHIQAIRHVIRPSFGLSYRPDLAGKDYYYTQVDSLGHSYRFSYYDGTLLGAFSPGKFGGINFGLQNNLEMKVKDKSDSSAAGATKKIKLIDNFAINSSYNLIADSFKLSPFSVILSTTLFEKVNLTGSTSIDPYQTDERGVRIDKYAWSGGKFTLGHINQGSLSIGTNFQSKKKKDDKSKKTTDPNQEALLTPDEQMNELEYMRNHQSEFADFNIPWTLNLSYSLNFSKQLKPDYSGFRTLVYSSVNASGDFNFSPKWKLGGNMFYDFNTMQVQMLTMFISREMHCWQMSINITPVGRYRSFNISLSPKSALLRDLKVNRNKSYYQ